MILGMHSIKEVRAKTECRCAICGDTKNLVCVDFIPPWTRVEPTLNNVIPLCNNCMLFRSLQFIELGKLEYLPKKHIDELMNFYKGNSKYLKMYTRRFGVYRTRGLIDIEYSLRILSSYDTYIEEHLDGK